MSIYQTEEDEYLNNPDEYYEEDQEEDEWLCRIY